MSSQQINTLYKFCDISTALKILESGCLRFSSPHLFEDPYELHCNTPLPFDDEEFLRGFVKKACSYIFAKDSPLGSSALFVAINRWREEDRFHSEEEAEEVLKELLRPMADQQLEHIHKRYEKWLDFSNTIRVANFSANPGYLMNWRLLADNHRGIALRFRSSDENALCKPRQVIYRENPPNLTTMAVEMDKAFGSKKNEMLDEDEFYDLMTLKGRDFKDEKEWRCFYKADETDAQKEQSEWYIDRDFFPTDLTGVVYGYNITQKDRQAVMDIAQKKYSRAKLFQASLAKNKFGLEFDKL